MKIVIFFILGCFQFLAAQAQVLSTSIKSPVKVISSKKQSQVRLKLEESFFYTSPSEARVKQKAQSLYKIGFGASLGHKEKLYTDFDYFYSGAESKHYLDLRELFISEGSQKHRFSFGRKQENWSSADEVWQTGIWQPRFIWSRLRMGQNGLLGGFYKYKKNNIRFTVLASPIYVPESEPQFDFKNNYFHSVNPWFNAPARRATASGFFTDKEIVYTLNVPEVSEVIFQDTLALQLNWQKNNNYCQTSFAYKPVNQIGHSADLLLRIDLPTSPPGVDVYPFINHHRIYTGECGVKSQLGWYGFVSINHENPLNSDQPLTQVTRQLGDSSIVSGLLGYNNGSQQYFVSLMNLWLEEKLDTGDKASTEESFFSGFYNYEQALKLGMKHRFFISKRESYFSTNFIWDLQQEGFSWISEFNVAIDRVAKAYFQADGIALAKGSRSLGGNRFLERYKKNDQISAGVQVVF